MAAVDSTPERRLRHGSVALIAGLGVVLAVGLVFGVLTTHRTSVAQGPPAGMPAAGPVTPAPAPPVTHSVQYELSGGRALNITYVVQDSNIAQVAEADGPWSASLSWQIPAHSGQFYSLSAEDSGQGTLKCRITVDGTLLAEQTVATPGGVVRCFVAAGLIAGG
ncbi:MmpS family transport accessory protein [Amycolatopsis taiwanensis]|uniref:MmpS family membrane protein n=1 Tax=Amycolatopsis taiwanensis TaxID=342230 RepID=A0A9W6R4T9_9PSEU|nr:MmpS family transport accessory protein [Amycolatopsis taiwanensis]GLY69484.1 hypothetical protein Atai01_61030 [Amycolatopsis taiwanensis]